MSKLQAIQDAWQKWTELVFKYAQEDPRTFILIVVGVLGPLFILSAFLSWKLHKHIQSGEGKGKSAKKSKSKNAKPVTRSTRAKRD